MPKCYICDSDFQKTVTNYPDGKDPCPFCVEAYREDKFNPPDSDGGEVEAVVLGEEELQELPAHEAQSRLNIHNLPVDDTY
jgi:hypothetical protein